MRLRHLKYWIHGALWCAFTFGLPAGPVRAQDPPYTIDQVIRLIESRVFSDERILERVEQSCLGFQVDESVVGRLRSAGATDRLISELSDVCVQAPRVIGFVEITAEDLELSEGSVYELDYAVLRPDSSAISDVPLSWSSTDTVVVGVAGEGVILARSPGEAMVTGEADGGFRDSLRVRVVAAEVRVTPRSPKTAAILGAAIPGGGELYAGNTARGVIALVGSVGALTLGFLLGSEDTVPRPPETTETCENGVCSIEVVDRFAVEKTSRVLVGAVAAGALWAYALIDGVRQAKATQEAAAAQDAVVERSARDVELFPADGLAFRDRGTLDITLIRVR